jgi:hypothetical protein
MPAHAFQVKRKMRSATDFFCKSNPAKIHERFPKTGENESSGKQSPVLLAAESALLP